MGRKFGLRAKFLVTYLLTLLAVLLLVNTYPLYVARHLTFTSKETVMKNQLSVISSSVSALEQLTESTVTQVMRLLDLDSAEYVLVTASDGTTLYEHARTQQSTEKARWGITNALDGQDAFYCRFSQGTYESSAAVPVYQGERVSAAVYLYEADSQQGHLLVQLQRNIFLASVMISIAGIGISIVFSHTLTSRIRKLWKAIRTVQEGEYGFLVDISGGDELAGLGDEFNALSSRLQTTEEVRRRFVSDASHELKTPLASIRLLSDSILQNPEVDTATVMEFVRDIGGEAERLARTTEKLLRLTRYDNKIAVAPSRVSVSHAASGALTVLRPIAQAASVTIHSRLGEDCYVLCVEDDIYQVVINLVENAVKYNVPQGEVFLETLRREDTVLLTVEDTGIGIPEESMGHIFDRFYRVDKARSRETGGSGLGLSIVRSVVEAQGGTVEAQRRESGGMRFTVALPYCPPTDDGENTEN